MEGHKVACKFLVSTASLVALGALPTVAAAQSDVPPTSGTEPTTTMSTEQAAALVTPSVVYVNVEWSGYVGGWEPAGVPEKEDYWSSEITLSSVCSGFVMGSTGYIVTAGHCVDPDEVRDDFVYEALVEVAESGVYTAAELEEVADLASTEWELEGLNDGSPLERTIDVHLTKAVSGIEVREPYRAQVVEFRSLDEGDAALLKIHSTTALPALELAPYEPETGAVIASSGYPASVRGTVDAGAEASFKTGRVSSRQTHNGMPFTEIDAAMSGGMSGGPTVDGDGRVIGINSWGPAGESDSFNFVTGNSTVRQLLVRNGVELTLSRDDVAYRDGLAAYFGGDDATAVERFDDVLSAMPSHALAQKYRNAARDRIEEPPVTTATTPPDVQEEHAREADSSGGPSSSTVIMVLAVVAAIGVVLVFRQRNRQPTAPCPACRGRLAAGAKFCGGCGHAVVAVLSPFPPPSSVVERAESPAESRTVSV